MANITEQYFSLLASGASLQNLIEYADKNIFHNPIVVVNAAFRVIAMTRNYEMDEPYWDDAKQKNHLSLRSISDLRNDPELLRFYQSRKPFFWKNMKWIKYPVIGSIIKAHGDTIGYILISEYASEFPSNALRQTEILIQAINIVLQNHSSRQNTSSDYTGYILEQLLSGRPVNIKELDDAFPLEKFIVYSVRLSDMNDDMEMVSNICDRISSLGEYVRAFPFEDSLFILLNFTTKGPVILQHDRIIDQLDGFHLKPGISTPFTDISMLRAYYRQARRIHDIGKMLDENKKWYSFSEYYRYMIFTYLPEEMVLATRPLVYLQLKAYDEKHNSELVQTLLEYFRSSFNINATAQKMHVHRNTIAYRLNMITEKFNIDLADMSVLQLVLLSSEYDRWRSGTQISHGKNE